MRAIKVNFHLEAIIRSVRDLLYTSGKVRVVIFFYIFVLHFNQATLVVADQGETRPKPHERTWQKDPVSYYRPSPGFLTRQVLMAYRSMEVPHAAPF